jgi:hypothetical protein
VQIGEQSLGLRHAVGDDDDEACRQTARERSDECGIGGAVKACRAELISRRRQCVEESVERRKTLDGVQQTWKRHLRGSGTGRAHREGFGGEQKEREYE